MNVSMPLEMFKRDAIQALRLLKRQPGFSFIAILALVIGIGSATAAFSILDPWLIRPLALKDANRLCAIWRTGPSDPTQPQFFYGYRDYLGFAQSSHSFEQMAGSFHRSFALTGAGKAQDVTGEVATENLFTTLGVNAVLGRAFLPDDTTGERVAMISNAFWQRQFAGSPSVVGQSITLNQQSYRIIGVLPKAFSYRILDAPFDADIWTPIRQDDPMYTPTSDSAVGIVARLKPDITISQAQAELAAIQNRLDHERSPLPEVFVGTGTLLARLQDDNARLIRSTLLALAVAVGCVLLIACANTTALILGRNATRDAEFAIRAALGSGVRRLLQQLFAESLALYLCGAVGGLLLAWGAVQGFVAWNPLKVMPGRGIELNLRAVAVAAALTLVSSLCFGALPAFYGVRTNLSNALRSGGRSATAGRSRNRMQSAIVAGQIAISLALVAGTGVLVTTLLHLQHQDFGFKVGNATTFQLFLPNSRYAKADDFNRFEERFLARLRETPGVISAASGPIVGYGDATRIPFGIGAQRPARVQDMPHAVISTVSAQYFKTLGIPIERGEDFRDNSPSSQEPAAIIDQTVARLYFQGGDPIGQYLKIGDPAEPSTVESPLYRIVGVAGDTKSLAYNKLVWQTRPEIYIEGGSQDTAAGPGPFGGRNLAYVVSTEPGAQLNLDQLQEAVGSIDPELPVKAPESVRASIRARLSAPKTRAQALMLLAGISLLLAAIGVYGVLSQTVAARVPEIAVRLAIGAGRNDILRLVLSRALSVALAGTVAAILLVFAASRALSSVAYGISALNPWLLAGAAGLLLAVALLAAYLPARRAASVDPATSLRAE